MIKELQDAEQGTAEYGVTQFTDRSPEEIKALLTPPSPDLSRKPPETEVASEVASPVDYTKIPPNFDWRTKGMCMSLI